MSEHLSCLGSCYLTCSGDWRIAIFGNQPEFTSRLYWGTEVGCFGIRVDIVPHPTDQIVVMGIFNAYSL